jgi:ribonuclease T1
MRRRTQYTTALLFAVLTAWSLALPAQRQSQGTADIVPPKAIQVYDYVLKHHTAPSGYVGGRVWKNRERNLPRGGNYHEFDVHPKVRGRNRGAERIVVDFDTGKGWYTRDHYRTFIPIPRGP